MNQRRPIDETRPVLVYGIVFFLLVFAVASAALYSAATLIGEPKSGAAEATTDGGAGPTTPGGPVTVTLVAKNLTFDKRTIAASPGADVTVTLDNQDAGVAHNVSFYTNKGAGTKIFTGNLTTGPAKVEEKFKAPTAPGNYFFRCDAHPDQMTGTFTVK
jgi:plastocyanin